MDRVGSNPTLTARILAHSSGTLREDFLKSLGLTVNRLAMEPSRARDTGE